ncbi:SEY1 [Candida oxycetoniae]|uniref:SEY1 n=1 Tax=Candida oxycetoniae TaxID=497107 RepID=A0AAI9SXS9_9ASCO|nr:SEY1 [Candida oxycetoniae]KAI3404536.2 SEY1 [Candida oxycetoniae]
MKEDPLSETSSSSSFVPVEQVRLEDALQIIDEEKHFNKDILSYISRTCPANVGHNYHIVAVFGSQSTGKSTLLNNLFNTNFDVMNEQSRQQTTKGIWLAQSSLLTTTSGRAIGNNNSSTKDGNGNSNIIVMDVEGTDGRERGEDQDFERKAALFALATSEVLILNIWEHQIGLYQGSNMALLKTVFEVNITLFGKSKLDSKNDHKVLLLVVIRDHLGNTPIENLAATVTTDLKKMWDALVKPSELAHLTFEDFFDIDFHALNHKILQPDQFARGIAELGDRLIDGLFKPEYHHNVPIDGWTLYAEKCWEQIETNKDLDLPTQQILVAQFKCDEIVENVFGEFVNKFAEMFKDIEKEEEEEEKKTKKKEHVYEDVGLLFVDLRNDVLEEYDHSAARYNQSVYSQKRLKLVSLINSKFKEVFDAYSKQLIQSSLDSFEKNLVSLKGKSFAKESERLSSEIARNVEQNLGFISLEGTFTIDELVNKFQTDIETIIKKQQKVELNNIVNKAIKKLSTNLLKNMQLQLNDPDEKTWDNILNSFNQLVGNFCSKYENDFDLNTSQEENEKAMNKFKFLSWNAFYEIIHKLIYKEKVVEQLQSKFDDKFRYDNKGLPRMFQDSKELENVFGIAKEYALRILPILTIAKLSDDSEIVPDFDIFNKQLRREYLGVKSLDMVSDDEYGAEEDEDDEEDKERNFSDIISETEKAQILAKFKKEIDAKFVETKRSIVQHITQIPYYIYLIIMLLGWNEFMAVIRNPFTFSLAIIFGVSLYVLYTMNLLKPALVVGQRLVDEIIVVAKEKLREVLVDDHLVQAHNLDKMTGTIRSQLKEDEKEDEDEEVVVNEDKVTEESI